MLQVEELGMLANGHSSGSDWDSNVITPGTEFMYNLSIYLRYALLHVYMYAVCMICNMCVCIIYIYLETTSHT